MLGADGRDVWSIFFGLVGPRPPKCDEEVRRHLCVCWMRWLFFLRPCFLFIIVVVVVVVVAAVVMMPLSLFIELRPQHASGVRQAAPLSQATTNCVD